MANQPGPGKTASAYFRSLDGMRGILILVVVLVHLELLGYNVGFIVVDSFFVLSGFLITWLLVSEWDKSKAINLKDFYYRRALRLLPALLTMLFFFTLYTCLMNPPARIAKDFRYVLGALFYFTNWGQILGLGQSRNFLAHTWTLSIEEQFYLLWPPILLLLLYRTQSKTSLLWWLTLATLCPALLRIVLVVMDNPAWSSYWRLARGLDTRADSLLMGCCAGLIFSAQLIPRRRWIELALMFAAVLSILGLIWLSGKYLYDPWMYCVGWFLNSLFTAIIIFHLAFTPRTMLRWLFDNPVFVYVGTLSYGLYLWHFPVFRIMQAHFPAHWKILAVSTTAAATLLSYYFIEHPCLRLKKRFNREKKSEAPANIQLLSPAVAEPSTRNRLNPSNCPEKKFAARP